MWEPCDESPGADRTGTDGVYVLVCRDGQWAPLGTVAEYVLASQGQPVTWAEVPAPPTTSTTITTTTTTTTTSTTVPVTTSFASVSGGQNHTCGVTVAGGVKCWGQNTYGQLGNGGTANSLTPADVSVLSSGVSSVSSGAYHTCAVTIAGGVKCWGDNTYGQLGNAGTVSSLTPVDVSALTSGVASVSAGAYHTCAVTTAGAARCWGHNSYGQLGNAGTTNSSSPVNVTGLTSGVASVGAGGYHTCAVTTAGAARCWGHNSYGQLGNAGTTNSSSPVNVTGLASGVAAVDGGYYQTCAVTTGAGLKCWGDNTYGQLGNGTTVASSSPADVSGLTSGVAAVDGGYYQTCAVTTGAGAKCWGDNTYGQLGNGTTVASSSPVSVSGYTSGAAAMSGGANHSCAVTTGGTTKCWGRNTFGQVGNGTTANASTPVNVVG